MKAPINPDIKALGRHLIAGIVVVLLCLGGIGGWAATTQIAGAVVASGLLVVDSNVKKVQHSTGGIVRNLFVRDGNRVKAGDILLTLDDTQARANLMILRKRLDELLARQAREEAERDGVEQIVFPEELVLRGNEPEVARLISAQQKLFQIRTKARNGQKAQLKERIAQLEEEAKGLVAQEQAKVSEIEWIRKELEGVNTLWKKNLIQFTRVVSLQRDLARAEGERGELIGSIAQTKGKIAEIELQILQVDQDLRAEVGKDLSDIGASIAETAEKKTAAEDQLNRVDILAPQSGMVHEMTVHTVGGVVAAGEPIMLIVPLGDRLQVEAKIAPEMIDQVHVGQEAGLRFSAFNQRTTPEISGNVSRVSPDLVRDDKTNEHFYLIRIDLPDAEVLRLGNELVPGMPVECFIRTDERTVISYLVKPMQDQIAKAFRER